VLQQFVLRAPGRHVVQIVVEVVGRAHVLRVPARLKEAVLMTDKVSQRPIPPLDPPECFAGGEVVAAARCPVDVSTYLRRHMVVVKHAGERHTFSVHEVAHDHVEWVGGQGHYDPSCPMRSAAWPRRRRSGHKPARPEGAWPGCSTAKPAILPRRLPYGTVQPGSLVVGYAALRASGGRRRSAEVRMASGV